MAVLCNIKLQNAVTRVQNAVRIGVKGKKEKIFFILEADENDLEDSIKFYKTNKNILAIKYVGNPENSTYKGLKYDDVYIVREEKVDIESLTDVQVKNYLSQVPQGVTLILDIDKCCINIIYLWKLCKKYSNLRFSGVKAYPLKGSSLQESLRLGVIGVDILSRLNLNSYITASVWEKASENCFSLVEWSVLPTVEQAKKIKSKGVAKQVGKPVTTVKAKKRLNFGMLTTKEN